MRKRIAHLTLSIAGTIEASIDIFSSGLGPELMKNDYLQTIGNINTSDKKNLQSNTK
jgi:hypothetical protein